MKYNVNACAALQTQYWENSLASVLTSVFIQSLLSRCFNTSGPTLSPVALLWSLWEPSHNGNCNPYKCQINNKQAAMVTVESRPHSLVSHFSIPIAMHVPIKSCPSRYGIWASHLIHGSLHPTSTQHKWHFNQFNHVSCSTHGHEWQTDTHSDDATPSIATGLV